VNTESEESPQSSQMPNANMARMSTIDKSKTLEFIRIVVSKEALKCKMFFKNE